MSTADDSDRIADAGEYVLGTLDTPSRQAFEAAMAKDPALQAEVYRWQDHLLGMARQVGQAEPSPTTWPTIEARLGSASGGAGASAAVERRPAPPTAPATPSSRPDAANDPLWQRLRRWRAVGLLGMAASVVLAAVLVLRPPAWPDATRYLAVLQAPDQSVGWVVESTPGAGVRLLPVGGSTTVPEGRSLQFWTKPEGAAGPTSLGLVKPGQAFEVPAAALPGLGDRQLFELTLEPAGGSPLNRPTGPVLYIGRAARV